MEQQHAKGWKQLLQGFPWFMGKGKFPIPAYSEFMPSPKIGISPIGDVDPFILKDDDLFGWNISELDEELELRPGMKHITKQIMHNLVKLGSGQTEFHISGHQNENLKNNPYWPEELSSSAGKLSHEKFVIFMPLALSKTQDDKGRVRWTLFGSSEQGPEKIFWNSFFTKPGNELPENNFISFIKNLLVKAYSDNLKSEDLKSAGFAILNSENTVNLPTWVKNYAIDSKSSFSHLKYLLTFRPFKELPTEVKTNYLTGKLNLLPFPGSLVFWGMPHYIKLKKELPFAQQIPLLKLVARHSGNGGIRVPQSGWIHEPHPDVKHDEFHHQLVNNTYHRTHRWQRVHKHEDELLQQPRIDNIIKVLFSTDLDTIGLYDKPLARNCQLWSRDFNLIIDEPKAKRSDILKAEATITKGGLFGYRFLFPPMRAGMHEIYWHRPVVAFQPSPTSDPEIITDSIIGYFTGYKIENGQSESIELWPRINRNQLYLDAIHNSDPKHNHYANQTALNIINLFDHWKMIGKAPIEHNFAKHLLRIAKHETFEKWLDELPSKFKSIDIGNKIKNEILTILEPAEKANKLSEPITFEYTRKREFEENWWNDINFLAHGQFINKDNADCVQDPISLSMVPHHHRDLEHLGDYLISRHREAITNAGMDGKAFCGELPFEWQTDFVFDAFGGWRRNQEGHTYERNILVVIPGKNRNEAVVMGDHYDTAYMEDIYEKDHGGSGARLSAAGADDNYSATSTLLQAAPIFLELSKKGLLERDIWLIHLTGEEFPSDCLGARNFCQHLIEKTLQLKVNNDTVIDLSNVKVFGGFVMDMIGHNRDNDRDIFQISPGKSKQSFKIAREAHIANLLWNQNVHHWNLKERHDCKAGERITGNKPIPEKAKYLPLFGEIRTQFDPHSSIYNTDGQIFSDIGAPIVLFMENYDLHRTGYHDTHDTMENIDLDYGAAMVSICIETVSRVACM